MEIKVKNNRDPKKKMYLIPASLKRNPNKNKNIKTNTKLGKKDRRANVIKQTCFIFILDTMNLLGSLFSELSI